MSHLYMCSYTLPADINKISPSMPSTTRYRLFYPSLYTWFGQGLTVQWPAVSVPSPPKRVAK